MQDDVAQAARVAHVTEALTADEPAFVTLVSIVELVCVLDACYALDRKQIATALEPLLRTKELLVERAEQIWQALRAFRDGRGDFADCLIERCAAAGGCQRTLTFDRAAAKHAGMSLIA